jgi:NADP-dependent 3-hydroxy acid dehydrogenase YdfG
MESKVVIVTGASRGIGLAVAESLLAASHKAVLVSRSAEQLQKLKERYPSQVAYLVADMTVADVSDAERFSVVESCLRSLAGSRHVAWY